MKFQIGSHLAGTLVAIVRDDTTIAFYDVTTGELLIEHPWPEPGNPLRQQRPAPRPEKEHTSLIVTDVLTHEASPIS